MANLNTLKSALLQQKAAIEARGGTVTVANENPTPAEISAGIETINAPDFSLATASAPDVADGKTFYGSAGTLITGTAVASSWLDALMKLLKNDDNFTFTLPATLTIIRDYAFYYCDKLIGTIDIPNTVESIGYYAFTQSSITGVNISTNPSLTNLKSYTFQYCKLSTITVPDNIQVLGEFCFAENWSATSITIGNGVTTIWNYCFLNSVSVRTITIGTGIRNIKSNAFSSCVAMETFTIHAITPPTLGTNVFYNAPATMIIQVPSASLTAYQSAPGWSAYANQMVGI